MMEPMTATVHDAELVLPAVGIASIGIVAVQAGTAIGASLFDQISPTGVVFLRQSLGAVILALLLRPRLRSFTRSQWSAAMAFGAVLAGMNWSMYQAVDRLPLAVAVTVELLGPIALSVFLARRRVDLLWSVLAVVGVVLLRLQTPAEASAAGLLFAGAAAVGWALYLLTSQGLGDRFAGPEGVAAGLGVAALFTGPFAIATDGAHLLKPSVLGIGLVVATLSAAVPFSTDNWAIRRLRAHTMSIVSLLHPVAAAGLGWLLLRQPLGLLQAIGIGIVIVAASGVVVVRARQ
jgi:inner membrane transporter RhtA